MEPEYDYVPSVFDAAAAESGPPADATRAQRLVNFLMDGLVCALLWYPVGYLISAMLYRFGADLFSALNEPTAAWITAFVLLLVVAAGYHITVETATRGRSLGKWITGTIAVRDDGEPVTARDAAVRSLLRLIPLDPFSALAGRPWHDRFSKTRVVQRVKSFAPAGRALPDASANYDVVS